jgi:hypothetical protein
MGPQGPAGSQGIQGPAGAPGGGRYDPALLATLRWDLLPSSYGDYPVGAHQSAIVFDGSSIWVANSIGIGDVVKRSASDWAPLCQTHSGTIPSALAFDGSSIWVASVDTNSVTKFRASDCTALDTFTLAVGKSPVGLAFDGSSIWVANQGSNMVSKL